MHCLLSLSGITAVATPCSDNCEPQGSVFAARRSSYWRVLWFGHRFVCWISSRRKWRGRPIADLPSYGGVVANSYLPSNWLSALGLYARRGSMNLPIIIHCLIRRRNSLIRHRKTLMTLMSCLSSVKPRVGTIWAFSAMSVIPRRNWPREKSGGVPWLLL